MSRRITVVVLALVALGLAGGIALATTGGGASNMEKARPTRAELHRLQERIDTRWDALARQGVYVTSTGQPAEPCVAVQLANPTQPNIEYVRRRFGPHVCVEERPGGLAQACTGYTQPSLPTGPVPVPDLRDLGLYEAARRAVASDLTYSPSCLGDNETRVERPSRHSPERLVRITRQCPQPGEMVPPGTAVALEATAILPGAFQYKVSALSRSDTGTRTPCADGRHATPPDSDR